MAHKTSLHICLLVLTVALAPAVSIAQHCPPIVESYLSGIAIERSEDGIALKFDYVKTGGRAKEGYQAYLLAYSDSDSEKLAEMSPQQAIENKLLTVLETTLIERSEKGSYELKCKLNTEKFAESMLASNRLSKDEIIDIGGWKRFAGNIRLAVFIPFLDDQKYSTIAGLPDDKHECNYRGDSALLFDTIPQQLSVHFGIVQATRLKKGKYHIQMNGKRPVKPMTSSAR